MPKDMCTSFSVMQSRNWKFDHVLCNLTCVTIIIEDCLKRHISPPAPRQPAMLPGCFYVGFCMAPPGTWNQRSSRSRVVPYMVPCRLRSRLSHARRICVRVRQTPPHRPDSPRGGEHAEPPGRRDRDQQHVTNSLLCLTARRFNFCRKVGFRWFRLSCCPPFAALSRRFPLPLGLAGNIRAWLSAAKNIPRGTSRYANARGIYFRSQRRGADETPAALHAAAGAPLPVRCSV